MSNFTISVLASISLILLILALYFLIKKWSKFHKTLLGKILKIVYALTLIWAVIIAFSVAFDNFNNYWEDDRLRIVTVFQGVKLGWSKDEVLFRKGEPLSIDNNINREILDYDKTAIFMDKGKVVKIIYFCEDDVYSLEKVGGIYCGSDIDSMIKKYGESLSMSVSDDKLSRLYNYPKYNVAFLLKQSKIEALAIFDPIKIPAGFKFALVDDSQLKAKVEANESNFDESTAYLRNPVMEEIESLDKESKATVQVEQNKETDVDQDHCAPNITKPERLRRLALKGTVRETGYQTYSVGNYEIVFSSNEVAYCK